MVEEEKTGILCEPGSVPEVTAAVAALLGNPEMADRMGRAGRERFTSRFSDTQFTKGLSELLQRVARGSTK